MKTENFQNLIRLVTNRDLTIFTKNEDLQFETEYKVFRRLPLTGKGVGFTWKTPKTEDKMLRSFITAFTSKYKEPNPEAYVTCAPYFSKNWYERSELEREYAYSHHVSNMYSKDELMKQIENNFSSDGIKSGLTRYGFYETTYGIGIFCFWFTDGIVSAIKSMEDHLNKLSIPFTNEFSDARWVYRFKLGLTKETHLSIINKLNSIN